MPTLGKTIFELSRIFRLLNQHYYNGELETPIITVQSTGNKSAYGWCTTKRVWNDTRADAAYYEITMTAEYLTRTSNEIVTTLLHEMVHLYCLQNDIKDVSRGNVYHNKVFKMVAESHGLMVTYDEKIGWSPSMLNLEARSFLPSIKVNRQAFRIARQMFGNGGKSKPKQSYRKYICPECGATVRATKDVNVICGDCMQQMLLEGATQEPQQVVAF